MERKKFLRITGLLILACNMAVAQVIVRGRVLDNDGLPLPGANITLKDTYDGASADTGGYFRFRTLETGKQILTISFIGYRSQELPIDLSVKLESQEIRMMPQAGEIQAVVITAGAFETGELKRSIVLRPMDIATTPSAVGDIYGAFATLPGAQIVGNEGGLYVRGGEGYETKTFIDGMQVANPYMAKMPDLPTRSRFSPILFTGTAFSTGGYTAEFGQALSSAINLNTIGLADKSQATVSVMSVGFIGSYTHRWKNSSLAGTVQYLNMGPYYRLFKPAMSWEKSPEQTGGTVLFRKKYGRYGMLKVFSLLDLSHSALRYSNNEDTTEASLIDLHNNNFYISAVYNDVISEKWRYKAGLAYSTDVNRMGIDANSLDETVQNFHHRFTITHDLRENITLKFGEEASWYSFRRSYFAADSARRYAWDFQLQDYAVYAEPEIRLNKHLVARIGLRGEYISLTDELQFVPRVSVAYKTGDYSQVSLAYGLFRQRPENSYLVYNTNLESEKATHLILNYQYEIENRIFRVEVYRKWYDKLVKFASDFNPDPATYSNKGSGFAQGVELFWRDSKSLRDLDYWFSYSYIYTRRNYKNYQRELVPSFISPHTFSAVMKYYIRKANTYTGIAYIHASPKTWYNPAIPAYQGDQTRAFNDLSLNITCIRRMFGSFGAILLNVSNLLGFENTYGYNYSPASGKDGNYSKYPIKPMNKRFYVLGLYFIMNN
jgi:hypothetical protein